MANIGIDLGTTHSLVAVVMGGTARCLLDAEGRALLPSAVRYDERGELTAIGWEALDRATEPGGVTFTSAKRFMGRAPADVASEAALFHYELADDARVVRFKAGRTEVTPVELSSLILKALAKRAEECLLSKLGGAVITVPAYFDDAQRQATRDAARLAGIEVLRLLNEPTAAALAYGLDSGADGKKVAVYDLGGGTFDVSILELNDGVFQVLSTAGDTHLGGDDMDQALAQVVLMQAGITEPDGLTFRRAVRAAEAAKKRLTDDTETVLALDLPGAGRVEATLDRDSFNNLVRPIVERTAEACRRALRDAGLGADDIDEVVLVGGSTRVPLVRTCVRELFGREPHTEIDPDQVVAVGAALQADILTGESELADDMLLLDVVPLSLGIEVMGGVVERLIPRCSTIPARASQTFTTHVDGQTSVEIHVLQGERELVKDNRSLARFKLTGLPPMPAGLPRVKVEFTVDANGILAVSAREEHTGVEARIEVQPSYGLTEDEIERMLEEAIDHAESDVDERLLIEARVEAEQIMHALEVAIAEDAELLQPGERERFEAVMADLRKAKQAADRKRIVDLSRRLDELSAPFAQRRIERDLELALKGRSADEVADALR